ncbi:MAG: hypothetical protein RBU30_10045 [Polyangia bacterium]|jgi:hypothetical protein|nr:hypothetical protein [Polyangia bacterium]
MIFPSWLITILAWAPAAQMQADKGKDAPVFFKLLLPLVLLGVLGVVAGIAIFAILDLLKKRVPLEEVEGSSIPPLASGEMTKFEAQSRVAPALGKVMAVIFISGLLLFMFGGLYTMGRGSGTTEQLRKEGTERQMALDKDKAAAQAAGSEAAIGEDAPSRPRGGEFGSGLDSMSEME